ncbi:hypothetical protein HBB16_19840 [Pseudonocardia sp. MCCB 268]|nr:hypothetical protein [Pseudonocardia cytotoxica]
MRRAGQPDDVRGGELPTPPISDIAFNRGRREPDLWPMRTRSTGERHSADDSPALVSWRGLELSVRVRVLLITIYRALIPPQQASRRSRSPAQWSSPTRPRRRDEKR